MIGLKLWYYDYSKYLATPLRHPCDTFATPLRQPCDHESMMKQSKGVARVSQGCRKGNLFAPLRLSNCPCTVQGWPTPSSAAPIESCRHVEFQICITLPHQRASEACRTQNSFIPTFSGHWSWEMGRGNLTT